MSLRLEKVNDQIRDTLIAIIHHEFGSQYGIVSITRVKTSPDLHHAKVYVSCFQAKDNIARILNGSHKKIRQELAAKINLKYTPEIIFINDETLEEADRIEKLLKKVKNERR